MFLGGPIATILLVRGRTGDHRSTDELLRLRRLSNPIVSAEGAADGLTTLALLRSTSGPGEVPSPGVIVVDMDRSEADLFLASVAERDDLGDLSVIVLDQHDSGPDVTRRLSIVRVARPAGLQQLMTAAAVFGRFRFEVEAVEFPHRYETRLWLCHADEVVLDLAGRPAENALLNE